MGFKVYFDPETNGFYQSDIHSTIPKSAVEIDDASRWDALSKLKENTKLSVHEGKMVVVNHEPSIYSKVRTEREWRDGELCRADVELNKVQDSDPKAVGTVSQWREYRKALRSWPENPNFPNKEFRPKAPDYKE